MMKNKIYAVGAAGVIALSLAACGGNSGSGSSPASGSAAADTASMPTVKMMVGGINKQIYLPYQLAEQLGYYKKYGVNMELSDEQHGGVGAEEAMASGQVDMAGSWYVHTVDFQSKGKNVTNLVQLSGAPGERLMCGTNSGVHSAADIKGKTMGVTDLGSGTDELTQFIASKAGITKSDYKTLAVGAGATAIAAIQRGSADCVMTTQPTVGALMSKNLAYTAVDLATSDGAAKVLGGDWPAAGLIANADWVKSHEDAAQKVVNAFINAERWANSNKFNYITFAQQQNLTQGLTGQQMTQVWDFYRDAAFFGINGGICAKYVNAMVSLNQKLGSLPASSPPPSAYINRSFVQAYLKAHHRKPGTC
jgi:NitT/TauT family transport system substrate-binding protein